MDAISTRAELLDRTGWIRETALSLVMSGRVNGPHQAQEAIKIATTLYDMTPTAPAGPVKG